MSTQTARGLPAGQADEERIERYLALNPDFFERHQPLLARMRLPHMRTGSTVSLVERQVEVLRDQKTDADRRLAEFIAVARANDQLAERIHRFTRRLLRATTAASAMTALEASLREDFDAFHSVLLLTAPVASLDGNYEPFLRKLAADDEIDVESLGGRRARYRVRELAIVDKGDTRVLDEADAAQLTLITCYPFDAVRPGTTLRYIVVATRVA